MALKALGITGNRSQLKHQNINLPPFTSFILTLKARILEGTVIKIFWQVQLQNYFMKMIQLLN